MAESRKCFPNHQLDLQQILQEAHHRWLRPTEIFEILRNYQKFHLTPDPPVKPAAGSLFLFDRKALRYFRKDGHRWRKKKDGKTVKEAHEKLKAGSVDVLHCYYAHGEDNENFQRRSYWMLDAQLEHIVLVHYREVKEGSKSGISCLLNADQIGCSQSISAAYLLQENSQASKAQTCHTSCSNPVDWTGHTPFSEIEEGDLRDNSGISSLVQPLHCSLSQGTSVQGVAVSGSSEFSGNQLDSFRGPISCAWAESQRSTSNAYSTCERKFHCEQSGGADFIVHKLIDARLDADGAIQGGVICSQDLKSDIHFDAAKAQVVVQADGHNFNLGPSQIENYFSTHAISAAAGNVEVIHADSSENNDVSDELKKLDSFGRWMDKEIGGDCGSSLVASDSGNYWNALDNQNDDTEVSSLSRHMQLDIDSLGPSLSQEQLFSIHDYSPDWAFSGVETKVLITGTFLQDAELYNSTKWSCMFGEIEVPAEILTDNVIRCHAPLHASGRVPFYVTCSNRLACSEVREFEYCEKPSRILVTRPEAEDAMRFQIRLAKLLCSGLEKWLLNCTVDECDKCKLVTHIYSMRSESENDWKRIEKASSALEGDCLEAKDMLVQKLLKDRLCEWLICKAHEGSGPLVLDDEGQGVIHLAAALGYWWAMAPIVAAGVSPNVRDARGRTALHWASYFGREETVIALVKLGASSSAVEDPTPAYSGGQTAADLASRRGHKGIAGYLAEVHLTSHLRLLTPNGTVMDSVASDRATEAGALQGVIPSDGAIDEQLSLRESLAALRKSAHAAALIQADFRAKSFRHRQSAMNEIDISGNQMDLVALGCLNKVPKVVHFQDYLHFAAVKIQQKYRGWKGRREFLRIHNRIVKIQAHVRGHQVRKQYKKFVWCVGIVEKAILRWRRKRTGLRGFRGEEEPSRGAVAELERFDEYEFLRIGRRQKYAGVQKALARVQSMVRDPEARNQYMRLVMKFENLEVGNEESGGSLQLKRTEDHL